MPLWHTDGGEVRRGLAVGPQKEETQKSPCMFEEVLVMAGMKDMF